MARAPSKSESPPPPLSLSAAARFVVLHGKDRFMQDEYLRTLRESLTKAHGEGGFDTVRFDGQQGAKIMADVMDECRSFGLMQQHKVVLVDNAELLVKETEDEAPAAPKGKKGGPRMPAPLTPREVLQSYAESPSNSATLVLRANIWRPGNLDKAVASLGGSAGVVIKCEPASEEQAIAWAIRRCKARHSSTIDADAAKQLVQTTGVDLGRIDTELEKLALAAGGDGSPITGELVDAMTGKTRHEEFFAIQLALLSSDAAHAVGKLRELVEVSRQDPVPITWAYIEAAKKLHMACRGAEAGKNVHGMIYQLKVFGPDAPATMDNLARLSKRVTPARAAALLKRAVQTDAANKSSLGEPVRNLEVLGVEFAGVGGG